MREQFKTTGKGLFSEVAATYFKVQGFPSSDNYHLSLLPLLHCACGQSAEFVTIVQYMRQYEVPTNNF
jgi:hypothetical protein